MNIKGAIRGWVLVAALYFAALLWFDSRTGVLQRIPEIMPMFPVLVLATIASLLLRFIRWQWLLRRAGYRVPHCSSLLAYFAGFAFTATPGKVGEMLRVRYLVSMGVPASLVVSAFVYERLFDLLALLLIASPAVSTFPVFWVAVVFVVIVFSLVGGMATSPRLGMLVVLALRRLHLLRAARILRVVMTGLQNIRQWATPTDIALSLGCGFLAWMITSCSFVYLALALGIDLGFGRMLALFPVSTLVGAASMLPGGLGSTEATVIALLSVGGVSLVTASLAAVGIRLATLWLATILGMVAFAFLEASRR
jgi:uncharacterized protein (TIRG00374 family)